MRHSNNGLTMNTYTDARLLDTASVVEAIGLLRRTVAPNVARAANGEGHIESIPVKTGDR
ncbi:MAG: hypothetical protein Aurels2KO_53330 [Aureliella sp.]